MLRAMDLSFAGAGFLVTQIAQISQIFCIAILILSGTTIFSVFSKIYGA